MKSDGNKLVGDLVTAFRNLLADVPFAKLEVPGVAEARSAWRSSTSSTPSSRLTQTEVDWMGQLRIGDGDRLVIMETKPSGQPRVIRDAVNQLKRWGQTYPGAILLFGAPYITPEAARIATQEEVGYVDLAGNCRLVFDCVYISREGWPNQFAKRRDLRSLYSPKAERVLRVMLVEPKRKWKIGALAKAAGVSLGQASNVKKLLDDREWTKRTADGIELVEPAKLLAEWAKNYKYPGGRAEDFYSLDPLPMIEAKLASVSKELGREYALTSFSAAARMAPMVRYQRAAAYVAGDSEEIIKRMGLKPVTSGANVTLINASDEGVFAGASEVDGMRIVSPVQAYLDLLRFKGRGEEAAQAILDEVIKPTW